MHLVQCIRVALSWLAGLTLGWLVVLSVFFKLRGYQLNWPPHVLLPVVLWWIVVVGEELRRLRQR